jgi:hypothetical protein
MANDKAKEKAAKKVEKAVRKAENAVGKAVSLGWRRVPQRSL